MATKKKTVPATKFRPLHDYLVVLKAEKETTTESGLVLTIGAQEESSQGVVLAVGKGTYTPAGEFMPVVGVAVGDTVLFAKKAGEVIKAEGEVVTFLKAKEVIAVVA